MSDRTANEIENEALKVMSDYGVSDPLNLIGKQFELTIAQGSHKFFAVGTFTGFAWSDETDLQFFISIPEYRGRVIRYLILSDFEWTLRLADDPDYVQKFLDENDEGQEECEFFEALRSHRFVSVKYIHFEGL